MIASSQNDPEFRDPAPKSGARRGFPFGKLCLGLAILVVLIALFLPAIRTGARPAARRSQCVNNLKQIMVALHTYRQAHDAFPPAYTVDANGRPLHSWRTLILPYLEQNSTYAMIDLAKPWDDPVNATAAGTKLAVYLCPSMIVTKNTTAYLAIVGPDGFLVPGRPRRVEEITDGLSSTLAVIEVGQEDAVPWMSPRDAVAATVMKLNPKAKTNHEGGVNAALADGSVKFLKADSPASMRQAILSMSGNDNDAIKEW